MKRIVLLTAALVLMMSAFAGCQNGSNNSSAASSSASSAASSIAADTTGTDIVEGTTDAEIIRNFLAMDEMQQVLEQMKSSLGEMGEVMDIQVLERDSKMVYSFQYKTEVPEGTGEQLQTQLEALESTYVAVAGQIKSIGVENAIVVVEYLDNAGEVLASAEFKAE